MPTRRLSPSIVVVATALALVAALGVMTLLDHGSGSSASDADKASEGFKLEPSTGKLPDSVQDVTLASLTGKPDRKLGQVLGRTPVVVNFFGSWCAPCIREMPAFQRVHTDLGGKVGFVGMAYRDVPEDALATVAKTKVTYPTYLDRDDAALTYFGGIEMPTTVFLDKTGKVLDVNPGPLSEKELRAKLADLYGIRT
ncbi:MAG TPA: TlpA disulfide reductase family protein [Acidimicrobiales bacterium]|nr:TlpA disulfide reductase family protein [Acidimicrobiales bacterium]